VALELEYETKLAELSVLKKKMSDGAAAAEVTESTPAEVAPPLSAYR
jgi:hypothetical protein